MKIYLATDHAGFDTKEEVKQMLIDNKFDVEDCGAYEYDEHDDYPDYISLAAHGVSGNPEDSRAIIFGGSGQGEAIVANKFPNVRAALFYGLSGEVATLSREHNNANILSIGARFVSTEEAKRIINVWLNTDFSKEERHMRRLEKIHKIEARLHSVDAP